jgi:ribosome-associated protein
MSLQTRQQVARAVQAVESKKADDVVILEMDQASGAFTDYFIVCSGTNPRQIQAIGDEVEKELAESGQHPTSVEGYKQAEWVLLDYVDFVVHIFSERARKFYDLERLWKSAARLTPADLTKKRAAKAPKGPVAKKGGKKQTVGIARKPVRKKTRSAASARTTRGGKKTGTRPSSRKPKPKKKSR